MVIWLLLSWALVFAVLTVWTYYKGPRLLYFVFRPLTMAVLIGLVVEAGNSAHPAYRIAVGAGLVASLIGDLFMMPRRKRFAAGLAAFLVAQACYTFAFLSGIRFRFALAPALALLAYGSVLFAILYPGLKRMRVPVLVYILAVSAMALAALERYIQAGSPAALAACVGAVLFLLSDSVLAVDRFVRPFRAAQGMILSTYFAAQALIALSTGL
ncbi:MAG TPA: lysoplasmalogenase [Acidobacteriota bacterium]|nr:lysoplasmalogenase [Acidobacteriota bacterium]